MTRSQLIAALGKATGPSRELDRAIARNAGRILLPPGYFTSSIDAALTLVPDGWPVVALSTEKHASFPDSQAHATLATEHWADPRAGQGRVEEGHACTLSVALCIAALRARENDPAQKVGQ